MRPLDEIRADPRLIVAQHGADGGAGYANLGRGFGNGPKVVWSNGGGWDHVSVSFGRRCPSWEEMCRIKEMFFLPDECCVEYHPAEENYVNLHPYCLHIWRPQSAELPTPPRHYV